MPRSLHSTQEISPNAWKSITRQNIGSWLDIAEIELSALGRQCIANNGIPNLPTLRSLLAPWASSRNTEQKGVDWHFTTNEARIKLKHFYPVIKI